MDESKNRGQWLAMQATAITVAAQASEARRALAVAGLDSDELKSALAALDNIERNARKMDMRARDLANGEAARRKKPMAAALEKAMRTQASMDWELAMSELAQAALDEDRPAWYASAMLSILEVDIEAMSQGAAKALCDPMEAERALAAGGYGWSFEASESQASSKWGQVLRKSKGA